MFIIGYMIPLSHLRFSFCNTVDSQTFSCFPKIQNDSTEARKNLKFAFQLSPNPERIFSKFNQTSSLNISFRKWLQKLLFCVPKSQFVILKRCILWEVRRISPERMLCLIAALITKLETTRETFCLLCTLLHELNVSFECLIKFPFYNSVHNTLIKRSTNMIGSNVLRKVQKHDFIPNIP